MSKSSSLCVLNADTSMADFKLFRLFRCLEKKERWNPQGLDEMSVLTAIRLLHRVSVNASFLFFLSRIGHSAGPLSPVFLKFNWDSEWPLTPPHPRLSPPHAFSSHLLKLSSSVCLCISFLLTVKWRISEFFLFHVTAESHKAATVWSSCGRDCVVYIFAPFLCVCGWMYVRTCQWCMFNFL